MLIAPRPYLGGVPGKNSPKDIVQSRRQTASPARRNLSTGIDRTSILPLPLQ